MSSRYIGGIVTKNPTALNPALGNAANGIFTMDQYVQQKAAGTWPANDPYQKYVTMLLHGDGTNGGQNNTFLDSSTNNFTITRNGNTTQGSFSPYGSNWSNYFNGSSDYLTAPANAAFAFGTGSWTVEAWVYVTTLQEILLFDTRSSASTAGVGCRIDANGTLYYSGSANNSLTSSAITANTWNHVAWVYDGTTLSGYINGVRGGTATPSFNITQNNGYVGRVGFAASGYMVGYVSNLRVVKGTAVYSGASFTVPTAPLTAITNTQLLTCQSNRFLDASSNAFTITVNGSPSVQRFSPFAPSAAYSTATIGGSGYFDGSGDYLSSTGSIQQTGDFTFECWSYRTAAATQILLSIGPETTSRKLFGIWSDGRIFVDNYGGPQYFFGGNVPLNAWSHIAFTRSGSTVTAYYNGVATGTTNTISGTFGTSGQFNICSDGAGGSNFSGYVTNARMVSGSVVYTTTFTPPTAPLTAISGTVLLANMTNGSIFDNAMMNDLETVGNAQISTSVKKYGTGSISIPGGGANAYIPPSPIFDMGTGDFTVECWVNNSSIAAAYPTFISSVTGWSAGASGHRFNNSGAANKFTFHLNGAGDPFLTSANTFSFGVWYHYALTRSGNTWRMFINGNQEASGTYTAAFNQALGGMRLGYSQWDGANGYYNGYIDDLRITKGYARYTANFTPPTSQLQDQ